MVSTREEGQLLGRLDATPVRVVGHEEGCAGPKNTTTATKVDRRARVERTQINLRGGGGARWAAPPPTPARARELQGRGDISHKSSLVGHDKVGGQGRRVRRR